MYAVSRPARAGGQLSVTRRKNFVYFYPSVSRYYVDVDQQRLVIHRKGLRWLLRRGSPLPIPNREVKPACADGTAILWESMSPPFLRKTRSDRIGFFVFGGILHGTDAA